MWAATSLGKEIDLAFLIITGACVALLAVITFLMLYWTYRYGARRNPHAMDIEGHAPLEFSLLAGSLVLVLYLFYAGWGGYKIIRGDAPKEAMTVRATGQMWLWTFQYENEKESNVLYLPANRPVLVKINSRDVLHSFFVPAFRVKQDAVPGSEKHVWFTPDKAGEYNLFCTEYCGTGHSMMITKANVMEADKFDEWLAAPAEAAPPPPGAPAPKPDGAALFKSKGCSVCHSVDGSKLIGPTLKGIFGHKVKVITGGKEREVTVDEEYIRRSELEPNADLVVGFPAVMPPQKGVLKDEEIEALIEYIKSLK